MRFFKRTVEAVDANYDLATNVAIALDPANRRVRKLEERGTPANGIVTGIRFWYESDTTRRTFAISVKDGDAVKRFGVRTQPTEAHRLRLGVPVVVKVDGDRGILDWEAMRTAWDLGGDFLSQESIRKPPDDGIEDTARDARVIGRLKKWTRTEATIVSLERRKLMGMATQGWDIQLRFPDGSTATSGNDEVPSYAQWYAAPGLTVTAVIDPKDPSRAAIDWPAVALAQFADVGFDDDPPPGSIAATVEDTRGEGAVSAMSASGAPKPSPRPMAPSPSTPPSNPGLTRDAAAT